MYKITIEEIVGQITKKTTIETDDVELVKSLLIEQEVISVHSDADNLNIDPEWQELMQWYKRQKEQTLKLPEDEKLMEALRKLLEEQHRKPSYPPFDAPYGVPTSPWKITQDGPNPFTVTC